MISNEEIERAKSIDLLTYLQTFEPDELVHYAGDIYTTKTHDSLKISNGKWMWWSRGIGGYSALDYLIKVKELPFVEAVQVLTGNKVPLPSTQQVAVKKKPKLLLLPEKSKTHNTVVKYLFDRGIDLEIILDCIKKGIIFESLPYHNVMFVGMDHEGKPRYAAYRATNKSRIMGDASGSDKHYSFQMKGSEDGEVHVFESAIDALSYATIAKLNCKDWRTYNLLSLAGVYAPQKNIDDSKVPAALEQFLTEHAETRRVFLHLDNDFAGRSATEAIGRKLSKKYEVIDDPPLAGKDINDTLCMRLGIYRKKERNLER